MVGWRGIGLRLKRGPRQISKISYLILTLCMVIFSETSCDCNRSPSGNGWASQKPYRGPNGSNTDAVDFTTSGEVTLLGFRMWGVSRPRNGESSNIRAIIRLYNNNTMIAERNGNFIHYINIRYDAYTFEVLFPQGVTLSPGVRYTATSEMITNPNEYCLYQIDGKASAYCSGVKISFMSSSRTSNGSPWDRSMGQIASFILKSQKC